MFSVSDIKINNCRSHSQKYYELGHPGPSTGLISLGDVTVIGGLHPPSKDVVSLAGGTYSAGFSLKNPLGLKRKLATLKINFMRNKFHL